MFKSLKGAKHTGENDDRIFSDMTFTLGDIFQKKTSPTPANNLNAMFQPCFAAFFRLESI